MTFWDWLWAWTRDDSVWEWLRLTFAALLGALIGGSFTLWGQRQLAAQQAEREGRAALALRVNALRDQSRGEAEKLFSGFTELHREIQTTTLTISQHMDGRRWIPQWREIWTKSRSLDLDVRSRLLTDESIRERVQKLVDYLDSAEDLIGGRGGFPSPLHANLHYMVAQLSAEGVELLGAYLRGDSFTTGRQQMWDAMARAENEYAEWEEYEIARAEAQAEEQMEDIARQERLTNPTAE